MADKLEITAGFGDTLRIALTMDERQMPYLDAVAAMKAFLVEKLGSQRAAEYEHMSVSDPGFAYFRRVNTASREQSQKSVLT